MYQAIVFDMDGVIFDSEIKVIECWKEIAEKYRIPDIEAACMECIGLNRDATRVKMLECYGEDFPYDMYKIEASNLFQTKFGAGKLPLKAGIRELLTYLQESQVPCAIASSTRTEIVKQEIKDAGLLSYFRVIIGGDMVSRSKPCPDIFLKACECLGSNPTKTIGIEDSYNGIKALNAAKMHAIMVPDLKPANEEMEKLAQVILPSLFEVKDYLEKLRKKETHRYSSEPEIPDCGCLYG